MRTKKQVEWKPTAEPWVIDRAFSVFVKNRCVFVHAIASKWRGKLNWAGNFANANRIVVLYIYGKVNAGKVQDALLKKPHQMLAVILPVASEDVALWEIAQKARKQITKLGYTEEKLRAETEKYERHPNRELIESLIRQNRTHLDAIDKGTEAERRIRVAQTQPADVVSNFGPPVVWTENHETELLRVIYRLYPCGVEANAPSEQGAKMLQIKRLIGEAIQGTAGAAVLSCVGDPDAVQLSLFEEMKFGAMQTIDAGTAYCKSQIDEYGCFHVSNLMQILCAPPYGWYECNYYAYIRARILNSYLKAPYLLFSGVATFRMEEFNHVSFLQRPSGIIFRQSKRQEEMLAAIREIFPTDTPTGKHYNNSIGNEIVRACCRYISGRINTPLACADERWGEVFRAPSESWCDKTFADQYYGFLTDIQARRREVDTIDHIFDDQFDAEKLRLFYKFYHVKDGTVGWLWNADDFIGRLEKYMANDACRECGKPLISSFNDGAVDVLQGEDSMKVVRFTKKEIVGLNKKFLGRYQEEFFCARCLCQILDKSPDELRDKIERFKQQGCELF